MVIRNARIRCRTVPAVESVFDPVDGDPAGRRTDLQDGLMGLVAQGQLPGGSRGFKASQSVEDEDIASQAGVIHENAVGDLASSMAEPDRDWISVDLIEQGVCGCIRIHQLPTTTIIIEMNADPLVRMGQSHDLGPFDVRSEDDCRSVDVSRFSISNHRYGEERHETDQHHDHDHFDHGETASSWTNGSSP